MEKTVFQSAALHSKAVGQPVLFSDINNELFVAMPDGIIEKAGEPLEWGSFYRVTVRKKRITLLKHTF